MKPTQHKNNFTRMSKYSSFHASIKSVSRRNKKPSMRAEPTKPKSRSTRLSWFLPGCSWILLYILHPPSLKSSLIVSIVPSLIIVVYFTMHLTSINLLRGASTTFLSSRRRTARTFVSQNHSSVRLSGHGTQKPDQESRVYAWLDIWS